MIDKKIFYCWFGKGQKSEINKKCIDSWKKFAPDYEIIEINESNFDVNANEYLRYCYAHKNWAFVSDYARMKVLSENSGFYFDTDIELLKPIDGFRNNTGFLCEQFPGFFSTCFMGSDKFPELFQKVFSELRLGENIDKLLMNNIYAFYDIKGELYKRYSDGFAIYGGKILQSKWEDPEDSTIAVHHGEETWIDCDLGGHTLRNDFFPVRIIDVNDNNKVVYEDPDLPIEGTIYVVRDDDWAVKTDDKVFLGPLQGWANYLFNPKVFVVVTENVLVLKDGCESITSFEVIQNASNAKIGYEV